MAQLVRLCLALEYTCSLQSLWKTLLQNVVQPLLNSPSTLGCDLELALVLFGAHPPYSPASVESSFGWVTDSEEFSQTLAGIDFLGGGGQPVALAEALLEAASLFALPHAGGDAVQQHCLILCASEPAVRPVPWPFAEDCQLAHLPGMATSVELCRAFHRRGIQLGFAGDSRLLTSKALSHHLANLVSDVPLSLAQARLERLKHSQDATLSALVRSAVTVPGNGVAVLPFWPQALELLMTAGAKAMPQLSSQAPGSKVSTGTGDAQPVGGGDMGLASESLDPLAPPAFHNWAGRRAGAGGATAPPAPAAAAPAAVSSGALLWPPEAGGPGVGASAPAAATTPLPTVAASLTPPGSAPAGVQWTPPPALHPTPPTAPAASPASFLEVLNAEILMSPEDAVGMPGSQVDGGRMQPAMPPAAVPPLQQPAVQGLPLPPGQQHVALPAQQHGLQQQPLQPVIHLQQQQQQLVMPQGQGLAALHQPAGMVASQLTVVCSARIVASEKVTRSTSLILGTGQVLAPAQHAAALQALPWPTQLLITKPVSLANAQDYIASKAERLEATLQIQYASAEAQALPERLLQLGAAGLISHIGMDRLGVLLPSRAGAGREMHLQLVLLKMD